MNNEAKERQTAANQTDMTNTSPTPPGVSSPDLVELPIVRLEGRRRLHGAAWSGPFPAAAAAMPIDRSRLTRVIGTTIVGVGAALVLLPAAGVIPADLPGMSPIGRIVGGVVMLAVLAGVVAGRDGIDRWWLGVRSARAARRWPPVTVFGVVADRRPGHDGWAIVALHPQAHGRHHYTRRGVVLRELGAVSESEALAWHHRLEGVNQRAAARREDADRLVLSPRSTATGDPPPERRDRGE